MVRLASRAASESVENENACLFGDRVGAYQGK